MVLHVHIYHMIIIIINEAHETAAPRNIKLLRLVSEISNNRYNMDTTLSCYFTLH
jgi:hypothetical protein